MNTPSSTTASIRSRLAEAPAGPARFLWGATAAVSLGDVLDRTCLSGRAGELAGRSVLLAIRDPLPAALALIELDGIASRLIICPPDVQPDHVPALIAKGQVDAIVSDRERRDDPSVPVLMCTGTVAPAEERLATRRTTEWVLLTSGTTGVPKMAVHSFASLTAPIGNTAVTAGYRGEVVWGTFYDIRRYGGLQIFMRAVLGRGSFVVASAGEPIGDYLGRLGAHGVTHISGTPSHWRRVLMSPAAHAIAPRYIRLSGEIADQGILNALSSFYPQARIGHAFASTEAGVAFEVNDHLEGFPANLVNTTGEVHIKVQDGSLRIRSRRCAVWYLGEENSALADSEGFVDTGDMVERRGGRYYFLGRRTGVINVGGLKVHPEEVEAAINRHPGVRMSMVRPGKSPITGSIVTADVVLKDEEAGASTAGGAPPDVKREILQLCHAILPPHKIPATIRFVSALDLAGAGKLARHA